MTARGSTPPVAAAALLMLVTSAFRQRGERACHAPRAQITTPDRP
jgi:hypothetical protein